VRRYLVVFEQTETGYSAYVPDLPGCIATGDSKKEVEELIYEAINFHMEGLKEDNLAIPEGRAEAEVLLFG